jgi:hypothetical protein
MIGHDHHLRSVGQVDPDNGILDRNQRTKPTQAGVAVAITPGQATTVTHERPPPATGHQVRQAHQDDDPLLPTDTQNVFLRRRSPLTRSGTPANSWSVLCLRA